MGGIKEKGEEVVAGSNKSEKEKSPKKHVGFLHGSLKLMMVLDSSFPPIIHHQVTLLLSLSGRNSEPEVAAAALKPFFCFHSKKYMGSGE